MRFEKIKFQGSVIDRIYSHALRQKPHLIPNADPSKSHQLNEILVHKNINEVKRTLKPKVKRKDAVGFIEFLLTFSPDVKYNESWLKKWKDKSMQFIIDKFGHDNIILAVMHRDESTPHLQVLVTPIIDGKLCARHWVRNAKVISKMQDEYHTYVKDLGLQRGIKGSKAHHQKVRRFYAKVNKIADLEQENHKLQMEVKMLKQENALLRQKNKAIIERMRNVNMNAVIQTIFPDAEVDSQSSDRHRTVYRYQGMKIQIQGQKFYDFMNAKGGGGAIDLVMYLAQCTFKEAVSLLYSHFKDDTVSIVDSNPAYAHKVIREYIDWSNHESVQRDDSKLNHIISYLCDERCIDRDIVMHLVKQNVIYPNKYAGVVFRHTDLIDNTKEHFFIRSSKSHFKQVLGMISRSAFWIGNLTSAKEVILVESDIDALSFFSLHRYIEPHIKSGNIAIVSCSGISVTKPLLEILRQKETVYVAFDNDKKEATKVAVNKAFHKIKTELEPHVKVERLLPNAKDWNEELQNRRHNNKTKTITFKK